MFRSSVFLLAGLVAAGASLAAPQELDRAIELHLAGDLDAALRLYRRVAERDAGSDPEGAGIALTNVCLIELNRSRLQEALAACVRATALLERLPEAGALLAQSLNNTGLVLQSLGRFDEATAVLERALSVNTRLGAAEAQAINLSNLGAAAFDAGEFGAALRYHRRALELAERHAGVAWAAEQRRIARVNLAVDLEKLGEYGRALRMLREALAESPAHEAAIRTNLAVMYRNLGDPVRAAELLEEAIALLERQGDRAALAAALMNLGLVQHRGLDDPRSAEATLRRSLAAANAAGSVPERIRARILLADLLRDQGRLPEALREYERARAEGATAGAREAIWTALAGMARTALLSGDPARSWEWSHQALELIEQTRARMATSSERAAFFADQRAVVSVAIDALWRLHTRAPGDGHDRRALELATAAKAFDLRELLGAQPAAEEAASAPPAPVAAATAGSVTDPAARRGTRPSSPSALLEYFLGERDAYLWVVRPDGLGMHALGSTPRLERLVRAVHARLVAHAPAPAPALAQLAATLLAPAAELLSTAQQLRVAPDGMLMYLPFELLPMPGATTPLLRRVAVRYTPSGALPPPPAQASLPERLLAFADPALPKPGPDSDDPAALLIERLRLRPLPAADAEVRQAARATGLPLALASRGDATETAFRERAGGGERVLHLATHAVFDERSSRGPAILLAADAHHDGLLYADEIARLRVPARLAVLAACSTALGGRRDGRAARSLYGAFLAAGTEAVVATLWDVEDTAAAALLGQFYFELGRGRTAAEALRRAKLRLLDDDRWRDRPDWAAFVLVGGNPRLRTRVARPWVWLLLAAVAALTAAAAAAFAGRGRS